MVVNRDATSSHVKFVSYKHDDYSLCRGMLVLEIDGEEVTFGDDSDNSETGKIYPRFWATGGECGFENGYRNSYIHHGEWLINANEIPEQYRQYADEIDEVINDNIEYGCCGGCL